MVKLKRKTVLRGAAAASLKPVTLRSFDRRPVNYFRDVISDEDRGAVHKVSEQEIQERIDEALAAERKRLQDQQAREIQERFKAGLAQGRKEASGDFSRAADLLNNYAKMLQAERQEITERCERSAVDLAFTLAEKIIGRELETKPETVADIARNALSQASDSNTVCIRVNPEDMNFLKAMQGDFQSMLGTGAQLEIRGDGGVERGGCIVETDHGAVDARIRSQLGTLRAGLPGGMD